MPASALSPCHRYLGGYGVERARSNVKGAVLPAKHRRVRYLDDVISVWSAAVFGFIIAMRAAITVQFQGAAGKYVGQAKTNACFRVDPILPRTCAHVPLRQPLSAMRESPKRT